jgi:hypothetical protein
MMSFRVLFAAALLSVVTALPAKAGFITIDHFTQAFTSDGLGVRSTIGNVTFAPGLSLAAVTADNIFTPTSEILYSFVPNAVVSPVFRVFGRNNQTNPAETGDLTLRVNLTNAITLTLPANQGGVNSLYTFDFTSLLGPIAAISDLQVEWSLTSGTGSRQLIIDFLDVEEVPEPATLALIGLASSGGGIAAYRRRRKAVPVKK